MIEMFQVDSIKQLIVYWLHWSWSRSDLLRCRKDWIYDLGKNETSSEMQRGCQNSTKRLFGKLII